VKIIWTEGRGLAALSLLLLLSLLTVACGDGGSQATPGQTEEPAPEAVAAPLPEDVAGLAGIAEPAAEPLAAAPPDGLPDPALASPGAVRLTGELLSPVESALVPKQKGRVGAVRVDLGDPVARGQVLLTLEPEYFELAVTRAEAEAQRTAAQLAEARRDLARKEELIAKGSVAQAVYDRTAATHEGAQASHAAAQATLALARRQLEDTRLRSPIDGVVAERRVDVGEALDERTVAFLVVQVSPLKLRFHLPERYLAQVRPGQIVRATFEAYPGEEFTAEVTTLGQTVDPDTRTLIVEARLPNPDRRLRPGMFAKVTLEFGGA
jgi:membrane fusion protein, multidrug efflux system